VDLKKPPALSGHLKTGLQEHPYNTAKTINNPPKTSISSSGTELLIL
jgi:hypothetical protein